MPLKRAHSIKYESDDEDISGHHLNSRKVRRMADCLSNTIPDNPSFPPATSIKRELAIKHEYLEIKDLKVLAPRMRDAHELDCIKQEETAEEDHVQEANHQDGMGVALGQGDNDSLYSKNKNEHSTDPPTNTESSTTTPSSARTSLTPYPPSGLGCSAATSSPASSLRIEQEDSTATFYEIIRYGSSTGLTTMQKTLDDLDKQISVHHLDIVRSQIAIAALDKKRKTVNNLLFDLEDLGHRATKILNIAREVIVHDDA